MAGLVQGKMKVTFTDVIKNTDRYIDKKRMPPHPDEKTPTIGSNYIRAPILEFLSMDGPTIRAWYNWIWKSYYTNLIDPDLRFCWRGEHDRERSPSLAVHDSPEATHDVKNPAKKRAERKRKVTAPSSDIESGLGSPAPAAKKRRCLNTPHEDLSLKLPPQSLAIPRAKTTSKAPFSKTDKKNQKHGRTVNSAKDLQEDLTKEMAVIDEEDPLDNASDGKPTTEFTYFKLKLPKKC